ncbi:MAG: hypothetical protein GX802_05245 [Clostridiales bacterium]|nr:hypothetical protein [Clostridiales bacterium]
MRKTFAFLLTFALLLMAGCTAPVENNSTPKPTDSLNTQEPVESATTGDFSFTKDFDLDGDGTTEEIKLIIHSYNEPTLVIGDSELKFTNHSDASYNSNPQITVCNVEGGKLIYIVLEGNANFYAHCAYYSDDKLTEIAFPFDYENLNALFPRKWLTDKQIEITCALGGESKVLEIDEEGFKTLSGVDFESYTKTNEFTVGDNNITAINAENGELRLIYLLEFENYWVFAEAELTLKFSAETQTLELSDVNYTVDDNYTWIKD